MESIPMAWLERLNPPAAGLRIELDQSPLKIGRASTCKLPVNDPLVSREHAEIRYQAGSFIIKDLDSANGTLINGRRVIETGLLDGDCIRLGSSEFRFHLGQDSMPTMIAPPLDWMAEAPPARNAPATLMPVPAPAPAPTRRPPAAAVPSAAGKSRRSALTVVLAVLASLSVLGLCTCGGCYLLSSFGNPGGETALEPQGASLAPSGDLLPPEDQPLDLQAALAAETVDDRPEVLARLGLPDAFTISDQEVEGGNVVFESWVYHQFGLQVDFVDGEALWTVTIEPPPAGTLFPAWYNPLDFPLGISMDEAMRLAAEKSPAGTPPAIVDLGEGMEYYPNVISLVGDQILMGFYDGRLIYVETVALEPGGGAP